VQKPACSILARPDAVQRLIGAWARCQRRLEPSPPHPHVAWCPRTAAATPAKSYTIADEGEVLQVSLFQSLVGIRLAEFTALAFLRGLCGLKVASTAMHDPLANERRIEAWRHGGDLNDWLRKYQLRKSLKTIQVQWLGWSERRDLNSGPPVPQTGALTGLRYAPNINRNYSEQGATPQHVNPRREHSGYLLIHEANF
jgi:hypothetical protein